MKTNNNNNNEATYEVTTGRIFRQATDLAAARAIIASLYELGEYAWAKRNDGRELTQKEAEYLEVAR